MPSLVLSPNKRLYVDGDDLGQYPKLVEAFQRGAGHGLLYLDIAADAFAAQDSFVYWRDVARSYLSLFAATPNLEQRDLKSEPLVLPVPADELFRWVVTAPPMRGAEYIDEACLSQLWREVEEALSTEIIEHGGDIPAFFSARHAGWSLLGRVCFHLAENKNSPETPFAFLATYAHQASKDGKTQHLPLSRALQEYASAKHKHALLRLLDPIHRASQASPLIKDLIDSGDIFQPLAWTPQETHGFLQDIPIFEKAGIVVRVPNWWKAKQPHQPQIAIRIGEKTPQSVGFDALLDFSMSVVIGDDVLTDKEIRDLLSRSENLVFFKGQWVDVDQEKLIILLAQWKSVAKSVKAGGITFAEGMRLLAGVDNSLTPEGVAETGTQTRVISGSWLSQTLEQMRDPSANKELEQVLRRHLKAELRHYQSDGVHWLYHLNRLRLGSILADDMGLGKTIQIIALLLLKQHTASTRATNLLVVPASLIGNWVNELKRFAPTLIYWVAHSSGQGYVPPANMDCDVVITTYGTVLRLAWLADINWDLLIADEAQALKNPSAKQTKAVKALKSQHRIALTGTPVENYLSDLWSLFDFVSPGLLGSSTEFGRFIKKRNEGGDSPYAHLRQLVSPYILRRLKTDKRVISDLPDKTELKSYCHLSKAQAVLYQESVRSLAKEIAQIDGIKRRGLILSYLMRFKQICNHPSHFVKDAEYRPQDSGKFFRLAELCEVIAAKQEKVLVFTQFKEMIEPLHDYLQTIFGKKGLVLHGDTPIKKRQELVSEFQREDGPPFFVLSLKAGGTGLNLTAASHVIHFDRWWNPAVENQATDRAFRIGQKRNVLVHKFICQGTLEEKIDALIESKRTLSQELLEGGESVWLTELATDELLSLVALDVNSAVAE